MQISCPKCPAGSVAEEGKSLQIIQTLCALEPSTLEGRLQESFELLSQLMGSWVQSYRP